VAFRSFEECAPASLIEELVAEDGASVIDQMALIEGAKVHLIMRGQYLEATPADDDPSRHEGRTGAPSVLNEVRVRCVGLDARWLSSGNPLRLLPSFTVHGNTGEDGDTWRPLCAGDAYFGPNLETRTFALCNVPRRRRCDAELEAVRDATRAVPCVAAMHRAYDCGVTRACRRSSRCHRSCSGRASPPKHVPRTPSSTLLRRDT
jgi:hypothetical protein